MFLYTLLRAWWGLVVHITVTRGAPGVPVLLWSLNDKKKVTMFL